MPHFPNSSGINNEHPLNIKHYFQHHNYCRFQINSSVSFDHASMEMSNDFYLRTKNLKDLC